MQLLKRITTSLYIIIVVALAFVKGYNSWFMITLWALLALFGTIYIIKCGKLFRWNNSITQKSTSDHPSPLTGNGQGRGLMGFLLHLSFLIILSGAMVTHLTQKKGTIHLRQGEPMAYFLDEDEKIFRLNYSLQLDSFKVVYEENGRVPKDYVSYITVLPSGNHSMASGDAGGGIEKIANTQQSHEVISMNNILRIGNSRYYQSSYDEDLRGSILIINRDPWGIPITYCGYVMMVLSFIMIILRRTDRRVVLGSLCMAMVIAWLFSLKEYNQPVLNTWLLPVHVSLIVTSYVMLFLAVWKRQLLHVAIGFLAMGIFIGAYWANISWGTYWSWDPKEVWALITMMVYAAPLHASSLPRFRNPRFYRAYMLIAFLCVLMTYFGVNYLLGGMHSYGA